MGQVRPLTTGFWDKVVRGQLAFGTGVSVDNWLLGQVLPLATGFWNKLLCGQLTFGTTSSADNWLLGQLHVHMSPHKFVSGQLAFGQIRP